MELEQWREIGESLKRHKLRTSLTAFGVFWGIFMLVVLLGAGRGLENGITANFGQVTNAVYLWSARPTHQPYDGLPKGRRITLKPRDAELIRARLSDEVAFVAGFNRVGGYGNDQYITRGDASGTFTVRGSHPGMAHLHSLSVTGRFINSIDHRDKRKVAIIGRGVREVLFAPWEEPIGQDLNIHGIHFRIVGTFTSLATGESAAQEEEVIFIPNRTLRHTFNQAGWIGALNIIPQPGHHAERVEEQIRTLLQDYHRVHPDDRAVFGSWNTQTYYDRVQGLFTGIRGFSWLVAVGTILAGAIGVGNVMLIVVSERTREIGIRKALGATPGSIVAMVVLESLTLTAVAGYLGLVAAVALLETASQHLPGSDIFGQPEIEFGTAMSAIAVLMVTGLLAAWLPASKAAGVDPILALQDE